jgi:hypothetical protein
MLKLLSNFKKDYWNIFKISLYLFYSFRWLKMFTISDDFSYIFQNVKFLYSEPRNFDSDPIVYEMQMLDSDA